MGTDRTIETLAQAILEKLSYIETHSSKTAERLATGVMNNVLQVATLQFPADGTGISLSYNTTCGAIEIANHGAQAVFVHSGPDSGGPTPRMPRVDSHTVRIINVASRNITLYGTIGELVGIQAFTRGGISSAPTIV